MELPSAMSPTLDIFIAASIGEGLGSGTIGFPIAYLAMRKQYRLLSEVPWRPYVKSCFLLSFMHFFGVTPSANTLSDETISILESIGICAFVLYFTFRSGSDSASNFIPIANAEILLPLSSNKLQDEVGNMSEINCSKIEIRAYRFLVLVWIFCLCIFAFFVYSKYQVDTYGKTYVEIARKLVSCQSSFINGIDSCHSATDAGSSDCLKQLNLICGEYNAISDDVQIEINYWNNVAETSALLGLFLALGAPIIYYGVRWALTGRLRPIWPLGKSEFKSTVLKVKSYSKKNNSEFK